MQKLKTQAGFRTADELDIVLEVFTAFSAAGLVGQPYTKPEIGHWTIARLGQILQTTWYEVPWVSGRNRQRPRC